tara:strand:+ start:755 stop:1642 length:888 start_codon:yes stop_codon:yes gene_type:complete
MKLFIAIFFLFNFIISDVKKEIPNLDLRNAGELKLNLDISRLFKNIENRPVNYLTTEQMDVIKENAKNYKVNEVNENDIIIIETNLGKINLKFLPDDAPNHCLNFKKLANSGFYDKTLFHRVVPGFMIQGGDLLSRDALPDNDGTGGPGWIIENEFNNVKHKRGVLSMARSKDPDSAGSQFFICVADAVHLDGKYTVFGKVFGDDHLLDLITNIPSEHDSILSLSRKKIPENANPENWVIYEKGNKTLYFKIPDGQTKDSYLKYINQKIKNKHRPNIPVIIKKIRVVDETSLNND